LEPQEYRWQAV